MLDKLCDGFDGFMLLSRCDTFGHPTLPLLLPPFAGRARKGCLQRDDLGTFDVSGAFQLPSWAVQLVFLPAAHADAGSE